MLTDSLIIESTMPSVTLTWAEEHLWVAFSLIDHVLSDKHMDAEKSAVVREMVKYAMHIGDTGIACLLLNVGDINAPVNLQQTSEEGQCEVSGQDNGAAELLAASTDVVSVVASEPLYAPLSLNFDDRLEVFRLAVDLGDADVLQALGNLRRQAETEGVPALGKYILEELRFGWNVDANLDTLAVLKQHKEGHQLEHLESDALSELYVNSFMNGDNEILDQLDQLANQGLVTLDQTTWRLVGIAKSELKSKAEMPQHLSDGRMRFDEDSLINEWLEVYDGHYKGREIFLKQLGFGSRPPRERTYAANKTFQSFLQAPHNTGLKGVITDLAQLPLVSYAAGNERIAKAVGAIDAPSMGPLRETFASIYQRAPRGLTNFIDIMYPELATIAQQERSKQVAVWHNTFVSPDPGMTNGKYDFGTETTRKVAPVNMRYIDWFVENKPAELANMISMLGEYAQANPEADNQACRYLAELELIKQEADASQKVTMANDLADMVRHTVSANRPLEALFKRSEAISDGAQRINVQQKIVEYQYEHDHKTGDTSIAAMLKTLIATAEQCLRNPIDVLVLGQKNIEAIINEARDKQASLTQNS